MDKDILKEFLPVTQDDSATGFSGVNGEGFLPEELKYIVEAVNNYPEALELLQYFIDRVENGSIRSVTTYDKYVKFMKNRKNHDKI